MTGQPGPDAGQPAWPNTVLGKAMVILTAFDARDTSVTLAQLVTRTGLPKSTVHRMLGELVDVRLLERAGRGYRLSGTLFELGLRASAERSLIEVATPFMQELCETTAETVHLGVREGRDVVYVFKVAGHQQATSPSVIGGRMPLSCTAIGKAILAFSEPDLVAEVIAAGLPRLTPHSIQLPRVLTTQLTRAQADGIAYETEESAVGLTCVAAPVLGTDDHALAAISVTGPVHRFQPAKHANAVRAAAAAIAATMGRRQVRGFA